MLKGLVDQKYVNKNLQYICIKQKRFKIHEAVFGRTERIIRQIHNYNSKFQESFLFLLSA